MCLEELKDFAFPFVSSRYIKKNYLELFVFLNTNYPENLNTAEKLYWWQNDLKEHPVCKICGKPTKFEGYKKGYRTYCSNECCTKDPERREMAEQTSLKRYGVKNASSSKEIRKKVKQTNIERFGVDNPFKSKEIQEKIRQTNLEKYGVEYYTQTKEQIEKSRNTKLERYGDPTFTNREKANQTMIELYGGVGSGSSIIREKVEQTNLEKYGVKSTLSVPEVREKIKQTCEEKYGADNPFSSDIIREKIIEYNREKFGYDYGLSSKEVHEKIKQTNLEKYGVENPMQREEVQEKIKQTNLEKYGVENPFSDIEVKEKIKQTNLEKYGVEYYTQTDEYKEKAYNTKKQNHTFNTSKIEQDFKQWLDENNIEYKYQYRSEEYPFNCDFYFPEKDLYFEIQGSWTHGEHPFDPESEEDKKTLSVMESKQTEYYDNAIEVWTIRDPLKRQWAKEHNLNWVEVFSCDLDDVVEIFKTS